jgi:hypothetical protein
LSNGFRRIGKEPWPDAMAHQLILPVHFEHMRLDFAEPAPAPAAPPAPAPVPSPSPSPAPAPAPAPVSASSSAGSTLLAPCLLANGVEFSVHELPRAMRRDLALVMPSRDVSRMVAVLAAQRSRVDLTNWGAEAAAEKDLLLERFAAWAGRVLARLAARGFANGDFIDPCSGLPANTRGCTVVWPEVDAFETLQRGRYRALSAGGCRIVAHPEWGTAVYPASLLCEAPLAEIEAACREAAEGSEGEGGAGAQ